MAALLAAALCACAPTRAPEASRAGLPVSRGLPNLARVDEGLLRSGQPDAEGFAAARALGVRTVLDLRAAHDERGPVLAAGLAYARVPASAWSLDEDVVARALRVATDPALRPVLVHCKQGCDRTGAVVAAYRVVVQGWSREEAAAEMRTFGSASLFRSCRRIPWDVDVAAMRERVRALPAPDVLRPSSAPPTPASASPAPR